jgi:hypothetical protein
MPPFEGWLFLTALRAVFVFFLGGWILGEESVIMESTMTRADGGPVPRDMVGGTSHAYAA